MGNIQFPKSVTDQLQSGKIQLTGDYRDIPHLIGERIKEQVVPKGSTDLTVGSYPLSRAIQGRSATKLSYILEFEEKYSSDPKYLKMFGDLVSQLKEADGDQDGWVTQFEAAVYFLDHQTHETEDHKVYNPIEMMYLGGIMTRYVLADAFQQRSRTQDEKQTLGLAVRYAASQLDSHFAREARTNTSARVMGIKFIPTNLSDQKFDIDEAIEWAKRNLLRELGENPQMATNLELILRNVEFRPRPDGEGYFYTFKPGAPLIPAQYHRIKRYLEEQVQEGNSTFTVRNTEYLERLKGYLDEMMAGQTPQLGKRDTKFVDVNHPDYEKYRKARNAIFDVGYTHDYPDQLALADQFGDMLAPLIAEYGNLIDYKKILDSLKHSLDTNPGEGHLTEYEKTKLEDALRTLDTVEELRTSLCETEEGGNVKEICLDNADMLRMAVDDPAQVVKFLGTIIVGIAVVKELAMREFKKELARMGCSKDVINLAVEEYREYIESNLLTRMADGKLLGPFLGLITMAGAGIFRGTDKANYFDMADIGIILAATMVNAVLMGSFLQKNELVLNLLGCFLMTERPVVPGVSPVPEASEADESTAAYEGVFTGGLVSADLPVIPPVMVGPMSLPVPIHSTPAIAYAPTVQAIPTGPHVAQPMIRSAFPSFGSPSMIDTTSSGSSSPKASVRTFGVGSILSSGVNVFSGVSIGLQIYRHLDSDYGKNIGPRATAISLIVLELIESEHLGDSINFTGYAMRTLYPVRAGHLIGQDSPSIWQRAEKIYHDKLATASGDIDEIKMMIAEGKLPNEHGDWVGSEEAYAVFLDICARKTIPALTSEEKEILKSIQGQDPQVLLLHPKLHYKVLCHSVKRAMAIGAVEERRSNPTGTLPSLGGAIEPGHDYISLHHSSRVDEYFLKDPYAHVISILTHMGFPEGGDHHVVIARVDQMEGERHQARIGDLTSGFPGPI